MVRLIALVFCSASVFGQLVYSNPNDKFSGKVSALLEHVWENENAKLCSVNIAHTLKYLDNPFEVLIRQIQQEYGIAIVNQMNDLSLQHFLDDYEGLQVKHMHNFGTMPPEYQSKVRMDPCMVHLLIAQSDAEFRNLTFLLTTKIGVKNLHDKFMIWLPDEEDVDQVLMTSPGKGLRFKVAMSNKDIADGDLKLKSVC